MALATNPTQAQVVNEVKTLDNNAVYNAGTLTTVSGSSTEGSLLSVRWYNSGVNGITTPYDGMKLMIKIPKAGVTTAGAILSINGNNADDYHPLAYNVSTAFTTHYAVNSYKIFTYDASATMTCYKTSGTSSTVTGVWKGEANYDSNNYACVRQYQSGSNAAGSGTKYPILARYNLTNKNGTYDTAYSRFHTGATVDTSNGNLDAPTISENGTALSSKYLGISATAADSTKLDGQASSYYLNYNNFTNTPTIPSAVTSINGLSGGSLTSPLVIKGGDAVTAAKLAVDASQSGQITDQNTGTLFGFLSNNATTLTVGGNSYALNLRGSGTRPQYKGSDLALSSDIPTVSYPVTSVNNQTGAVTLTASDVGAASSSDLSSYYPKSGGALNSGAVITMIGSNPYVGLQETGGTQYYLQGYQGELGISVGGSWNTKRISLNSSGAVTIPGTVSASSVYATSDRRLKENIKPAELDCGQVIDKLQIKEFNFKADEEKKVVVGAIAQELKAILPEKYQAELVGGNEDTQYTINEGKLLFVAIGALKEEREKTKELEERLARLEELIKG